MSDPVFLTVTGTKTYTLGSDPHAIVPGQRVSLTIAGVEVHGRVTYAEAAVWEAGQVRVMVDGEERTRIVDRGDVRPETVTLEPGVGYEFDYPAEFVTIAIPDVDDTVEGRRTLAKATGAGRVSVKGGPWCDADGNPITEER